MQRTTHVTKQHHLPLVPLVTAGACPAGGCCLALACDIRLASDSCSIGLNEVALGIPVPAFWAQLMVISPPHPVGFPVQKPSQNEWTGVLRISCVQFDSTDYPSCLPAVHAFVICVRSHHNARMECYFTILCIQIPNAVSPSHSLVPTKGVGIPVSENSTVTIR
jgi:hypothetical protein